MGVAKVKPPPPILRILATPLKQTNSPLPTCLANIDLPVEERRDGFDIPKLINIQGGVYVKV